MTTCSMYACKFNFKDFISTFLAYSIFTIVIIYMNNSIPDKSILKNSIYGGKLFIILLYGVLPLFYIKLVQKEPSILILDIFIRIGKVTETTLGVVFTYWSIKYLFWLFYAETIDARIYLVLSIYLSFFLFTKYILSFLESTRNNQPQAKNTQTSSELPNSTQFIFALISIIFSFVTFIYFLYTHWTSIINSI